MAKVLFFNLPFYGHMNPTLPLVAELVHRGEHFIYYSSEAFRPAIEQAVSDRSRPLQAEIDLALPIASGFLTEQFGHDGPNLWTGSVTAPMVLQHENALIAAYDPTTLQRSLAGPWTHAWFPKPFFHEVISKGGWTFGRVDEGFVGLFSAQPLWSGLA